METKKVFKVPASGLKEESFEGRKHVVYVPADITLDDMLLPETWANVANEMTPFDSVLLLWEDATREALLRVLDVSRTEARLGVIYALDEYGSSGAAVSDTPNYKVKYMGKARWCVIRLSDNEIVSRNHASRDFAETEMFNQLKMMG